MAGVGGGEIVLDVRGAPVNGATGEKKAGTRQPERPSIYQVPAWIRGLNSSAYTPRFVSFGPYHHGAADLQPMEKHKRTARSRFLRRANKNLDQLKGAVEDLVDDLMDSYEGLDKQWRNDREGFLDLMVLDGCFMLELLIHGYPNNYLAPNATATQGYSEDNPIFGKKGPYMLPHIRRDMLLIENQLPLVLLERLAQSTPGVLPFLHPMISSSSSSLKAEVDHGLDPINAAARILSGNYDRSHKQERSEEARFLSIKVRALPLVCLIDVCVLYIFLVTCMLTLIKIFSLNWGGRNDIATYRVWFSGSWPVGNSSSSLGLYKWRFQPHLRRDSSF